MKKQKKKAPRKRGFAHLVAARKKSRRRGATASKHGFDHAASELVLAFAVERQLEAAAANIGVNLFERVRDGRIIWPPSIMNLQAKSVISCPPRKR
jgi:hypothetical protein